MTAERQTVGSTNKLLKLARNEMEIDENNDVISVQEEEFVEVTAKKRKRDLQFEKIFKNCEVRKETNFVLQNRYSPLEKQQPEKPGNDVPVNTKPQTPPPIIVHQTVSNHKEFIKVITEIVGKQFHVKYSNDRTIIQTYTSQNYKTLMKEIAHRTASRP